MKITADEAIGLVADLRAQAHETEHRPLHSTEPGAVVDEIVTLVKDLRGRAPHNDVHALAGLCDAARCPQATFHPQHRDVWAGCANTTTTFLGNPRLPAGEAARLGAEHARAQRVVEAIDSATDAGAGR